ncbi:DUF2867 domain-containing protein [Stenotrophomonas rhizophila]|uniref:DUF2867 domain-containing protein n=1 Tax=Stenotrophomonas rhizophila TaxID=216778 RepID=UPI001E45F1B5|nr:DUF2867 domain-containing protein [Stenotrophomonas rhizophila]MCC7634615.1 DUF2867 domain-containing protein [Stenotrophomonas rhizophila]MCC7664116.1 DUF2867 domain-containing protein [Stenotrophomonas rhizophila]
MLDTTRVSRSFPSISLPSFGGGSPVEVTLIAQLGIGAGDLLLRDAGLRQAAHPRYIDALDEPSARLGGMHLAQEDASSLYSFSVGRQGHPFHRHAGVRMFTAIAGSGGAQLRFSTASDAQLQRDPAAFVQALRCVDIPPDSLFTVRFGSATWHQFVSRHPRHPALFALSCHADERAGTLTDAQRACVLADAADIPCLTETLPPALQRLLAQADLSQLPVVSLSLRAPTSSVLAFLCARSRGLAGRLRAGLARRDVQGHVGRRAAAHPVRALAEAPADSLLRQALASGFHHQDYTTLSVPAHRVGCRSAQALLERVLEGFMHNPPAGVARLMAVRNVLVAPLRLRTSPLGCPASSLLSSDCKQRFAQRFPVHAQAVDSADRCAEVLLGADDRHLRFRSCVRVQLHDDGSAEVALGMRVHTLNRFGRCYMMLVDPLHRRHIAPAMLRMAVAYALAPELVQTTAAHDPLAA